MPGLRFPITVHVDNDLQVALQDIFDYKWLPPTTDAIWYALLLGLKDSCAFYGIAHDTIEYSEDFLSRVSSTPTVIDNSILAPSQNSGITLTYQASITAYNTFLVDYWISMQACQQKTTEIDVATRLLYIGTAILFQQIASYSGPIDQLRNILLTAEHPYTMMNISHWNEVYVLAKTKLRKEFENSLRI